MKFKLKLIKLFLFNLCACSTFTFIATKTQSTVAMESMNNEKKEKNISNKDFVSTMSEKFVTIFKKYFNMVKNKNKDNSNIKSFFESKDLEWLLRGQANSLLYNNNNYNESIIKKTLIPGLFSDNIDMKNLFKEYDNKIQQNGYRKYILDEKKYDNYYDLIKCGGYYDLKSENYDNFFDKLKINCQDFFLSNISNNNELNKQEFSNYLVKQFKNFLNCQLCDDFVITRYFCFGIKLYYDMKNLPKMLVNKSSDNDKNDVNQDEVNQDITKIEQMLVDTAKRNVLDNFNNMLTESLDNTFKEINDIQLFTPNNGNFLTDMNKMSNTLQNLKYLPNVFHGGIINKNISINNEQVQKLNQKYNNKEINLIDICNYTNNKEFDSYVNDVLLEKVDQIFFKDNVVGKLEYLIDTKNDEDNVTDVENIFVKKYFYIILNNELDWSGKDNLKLKNEELDEFINAKFKNPNIYKIKNLLLIYLKSAYEKNNISNFSKLIKNVLTDYKKLKDKCKENNYDVENHANPQIYSDFFQICRKLISIYMFLFYKFPMLLEESTLLQFFNLNNKIKEYPPIIRTNEHYDENFIQINYLLLQVTQYSGILDKLINKKYEQILKNLNLIENMNEVDIESIKKFKNILLNLKYLLEIFYYLHLLNSNHRYDFMQQISSNKLELNNYFVSKIYFAQNKSNNSGNMNELLTYLNKKKENEKKKNEKERELFLNFESLDNLDDDDNIAIHKVLSNLTSQLITEFEDYKKKYPNSLKNVVSIINKMISSEKLNIDISYDVNDNSTSYDIKANVPLKFDANDDFSKFLNLDIDGLKKFLKTYCDNFNNALNKSDIIKIAGIIHIDKEKLKVHLKDLISSIIDKDVVKALFFRELEWHIHNNIDAFSKVKDFKGRQAQILKEIESFFNQNSEYKDYRYSEYFKEGKQDKKDNKSNNALIAKNNNETGVALVNNFLKQNLCSPEGIMKINKLNANVNAINSYLKIFKSFRDKNLFNLFLSSLNSLKKYIDDYYNSIAYKQKDIDVATEIKLKKLPIDSLNTHNSDVNSNYFKLLHDNLMNHLKPKFGKLKEYICTIIKSNNFMFNLFEKSDMLNDLFNDLYNEISKSKNINDIFSILSKFIDDQKNFITDNANNSSQNLKSQYIKKWFLQSNVDKNLLLKNQKDDRKINSDICEIYVKLKQLFDIKDNNIKESEYIQTVFSKSFSKLGNFSINVKNDTINKLLEVYKKFDQDENFAKDKLYKHKFFCFLDYLINELIIHDQKKSNINIIDLIFNLPEDLFLKYLRWTIYNIINLNDSDTDSVDSESSWNKFYSLFYLYSAYLKQHKINSAITKFYDNHSILFNMKTNFNNIQYIQNITKNAEQISSEDNSDNVELVFPSSDNKHNENNNNENIYQTIFNNLYYYLKNIENNNKECDKLDSFLIDILYILVYQINNSNKSKTSFFPFNKDKKFDEFSEDNKTINKDKIKYLQKFFYEKPLLPFGNNKVNMSLGLFKTFLQELNSADINSVKKLASQSFYDKHKEIIDNITNNKNNKSKKNNYTLIEILSLANNQRLDRLMDNFKCFNIFDLNLTKLISNFKGDLKSFVTDPIKQMINFISNENTCIAKSLGSSYFDLTSNENKDSLNYKVNSNNDQFVFGEYKNFFFNNIPYFVQDDNLRKYLKHVTDQTNKMPQRDILLELFINSVQAILNMIKNLDNNEAIVKLKNEIIKNLKSDVNSVKDPIMQDFVKSINDQESFFNLCEKIKGVGFFNKYTIPRKFGDSTTSSDLCNSFSDTKLTLVDDTIQQDRAKYIYKNFIGLINILIKIGYKINKNKDIHLDNRYLNLIYVLCKFSKTDIYSRILNQMNELWKVADVDSLDKIGSLINSHSRNFNKNELFWKQVPYEFPHNSNFSASGSSSNLFLYTRGLLDNIICEMIGDSQEEIIKKYGYKWSMFMSHNFDKDSNCYVDQYRTIVSRHPCDGFLRDFYKIFSLFDQSDAIDLNKTENIFSKDHDESDEGGFGYTDKTIYVTNKTLAQDLITFKEHIDNNLFKNVNENDNVTINEFENLFDKKLTSISNDYFIKTAGENTSGDILTIFENLNKKSIDFKDLAGKELVGKILEYICPENLKFYLFPIEENEG